MNTDGANTIASKLAIIGVLTLVWAAPVAQAQQDLAISVQLSTLNTRLLPMQPVRLIVRVMVLGDQPVRGAFILRPEAGRCGLVVDAQDVTRQVNIRDMVLSGMGLGDAFPPALTYEPGFEQTLDAVALYDLRTDEYLFPSPGRYDLRFWVQFFAGTGPDDFRPTHIRSNTVTLTVEQAQDWEWFASCVWRLPWGMPQGRGGDQAVTGFVDDDTSYSKYARFAMSGWPAISVGERIRLLEELADSAPPPQIHDLVLLRLATLLFEKKDFEGCRRYASRLVEMSDAPEHTRESARELQGGAARTLGQ